MKKLLLSFTVVFSLSGCLMSPGTNSTLGCNPITGCSERNHYHQSVRKANIGAAVIGLAGAVAGASTGDPFITAAGALGGMVLGYSIGDAMDKVDEIYATINLRNALNNNPDGAYSVYTNPNKRVAVAAAPTSTNGNCRTFENVQTVENTQKRVTGTACKINGEWILKELNG